MEYAEDIVKQLKHSRQTAIFGAGIMALGVVNCLLQPPYKLSLLCCLVSDKGNNPAQISGIPVLDFAEAEGILDKDAFIIVAAIDKNLNAMCRILEQHGYFHILPLGYEDDLWSLLRGNFYREQCVKQGKLYLCLEDELQNKNARVFPAFGGKENEPKTISIYTAKCHVDRELQEDLSRYFWEIPIQVGAALTEQRICPVCDNTGENISDKNRQYCELTALYWIWKNDCSDYAGLGHYRRHFELDEDGIKRLGYSDIDVVLTIPIFDFPSVGEVYARDHVQSDWLVMMEAIQTICPEYLPAAYKMQNGNFYYAYNMFIMRREILENYCSWLFPILFYCEEHCTGERSTYQGRYIGFLAEHLMSLYFFYHEKEYKIVHARKHFVEQ